MGESIIWLIMMRLNDVLRDRIEAGNTHEYTIMGV